MKKLIILSFLLTMPYAHSMELALHQTPEQKQEQHEKDMRAARAFFIFLPNWSPQHTFKTFEKLNPSVKSLVNDRLPELKNPLHVFFTFPKDILVATIQGMVPQYELKSKVNFGTSQYTQYKNGYAVPKPFVLHPAPAQATNAEQPEMMSTHHALEKLLTTQKVPEAFIAIAAYANQDHIVVTDVVENPSVARACGDSDNSDMLFDDADLTKSYGLSFEDYSNTTHEQRALLKKIAQDHNAGRYGKFDKRYKMTQADIDLLLPIKEIIDRNDLYRLLQVNIDVPSKTKYDSFKDTLLFAVPLGITEGIVPHMIYTHVDGKLQGLLGSGASCGAGFLIGRWIFPLFDFFNSDAQKLRKFFGNQNRTVFEKKQSFALLGIFHFIAHTIAQKLLSCQALPWQALGYTVHGLRLLSATLNIADLRSHLRGSSLWIFADIFHLKKHEHILERRNADDKSYTLGDLLNGQATKKI